MKKRVLILAVFLSIFSACKTNNLISIDTEGRIITLQQNNLIPDIGDYYFENVCKGDTIWRDFIIKTNCDTIKFSDIKHNVEFVLLKPDGSVLEKDTSFLVKNVDETVWKLRYLPKLDEGFVRTLEFKINNSRVLLRAHRCMKVIKYSTSVEEISKSESCSEDIDVIIPNIGSMLMIELLNSNNELLSQVDCPPIGECRINFKEYPIGEYKIKMTTHHFGIEEIKIKLKD